MQSKYFIDQESLDKQAKAFNQEVIHQLNFLSNVVQPLGYDVVVGDRMEAAPKKNDAIATIFGSVLEPCAATLKSEDNVLHVFCNSDVFNNSAKKNPSLSLYVKVASNLLLNKQFDLLKGLVFTLNVTSDGALVRKLLKAQDHQDLVDLCNPKKMFSNIITPDVIYFNAELGTKLLSEYKSTGDLDLKLIVNKINSSFSLLNSDIDITRVNFFDQEKLIEFLSPVIKDKNDFLQDTETVKSSFIVHAEILASIFKFMSKGYISDDVGISKLCCFLCKEYLDFREEKYTGMHNIYFGQSIKSIMQAEDYQLFDKNLKNRLETQQLQFFASKLYGDDLKLIILNLEVINELVTKLKEDTIGNLIELDYKSYMQSSKVQQAKMTKKYFFEKEILSISEGKMLPKLIYLLKDPSNFADNFLSLKQNISSVLSDVKKLSDGSIIVYDNSKEKQDYSFSKILDIEEHHEGGFQQEEFKASELIGDNP